MGISLVALGIFFLLKYNQEEDHKKGLVIPDLPSTTEEWVAGVVDDIGWLPLVSLMAFITAFSLGFGPIPWMLIGEILPSRAIGIAASLCTSFNWFLAFLVTLFFEKIKEAMTIQWCYFSFAIVCGIGVLYVLFIVPETKGKSLEEIQAMFGESESIMNNSNQNGGGAGGRRTSRDGKSNPGFEKEKE